eukprot:TRINITY_DN2715_c0_g1_i1.p3 TRINITY_DN2715_c0_g1~~TRINITY_DN2715_c0_g1_i1.p3  ORF type:complete len:125 (-),score=50.71 TRINITY_DN2715_c0_g1_i1:342-716(-)
MAGSLQESISRHGRKQQLSLARLRTAVSSLAAAAQKADDHVRRRLDATQINDRLIFAERMLLGPGLPMRTYYKHVVQAPGLFSGRPAVSLPGVLHGLKSSDYKLARTLPSLLLLMCTGCALTLA